MPNVTCYVHKNSLFQVKINSIPISNLSLECVFTKNDCAHRPFENDSKHNLFRTTLKKEFSLVDERLGQCLLYHSLAFKSACIQIDCY